MTLHIRGKDYEANSALMTAAKRLVRDFLDGVQQESEAAGVKRFYTAVVLMMYVVSSSILGQMGPRALREITNAAGEKEKEAIDSVQGKFGGKAS